MAIRGERAGNYTLDENGRRRLPKLLAKRVLPLEVVYFATSSNYRTKKNPEGQWVAYATLADPATGAKKKTVAKAFGDDPVAAVEHLEGLRKSADQAKAARNAPKTMADLFEYCSSHLWQGKASTTVKARRSRWQRFAAQYWGPRPLADITRGEAQRWFAEQVTNRSVPPHQLQELKGEMFSMGERIGDLDVRLEEKKNPFREIALVPPPQRKKVTIERRDLPSLEAVSLLLAAPKSSPRGQFPIVTPYVVEMWLLSLYTGLRLGEVVPLSLDQIDLVAGVLTVDRAMRVESVELDLRTLEEGGDLKSWALHLPKGGVVNADRRVRRVRRVPISQHADRLLRVILSKKTDDSGPLRLVWPSESGGILEKRLVEKAFASFRSRLQEVAMYADPSLQDAWPEVPTMRGRARNMVIEMVRANPEIALPPIFNELDFRDARSGFATMCNSMNITDATRDHLMGHLPEGVGAKNYVEITDDALQRARRRLSRAWRSQTGDLH